MMKKTIAIISIAAFAGCSTPDKLDNLLFEENALLIAEKAPTKKDLDIKDYNEYRVNHLSRQR